MNGRLLARLSRTDQTRLTDLAAMTVLGATSVALHLWSAAILPSSANLPLFGSDTARTARHMTVRAPMLDRSQFHLLFPLFAQTPTRVAMTAGLGPLDAVHVAIAAWGGVATVAFYLVGRRLGLGPLTAAGPAALVTVAGASMVFFGIPETYGVGAGLVTLSILLITGWRARPPVAEGSMALLLGGCVTLPAVVLPVVAVWRSPAGWRRRAAQAVGALAALAVLLVVQRLAFGTHINATLAGESQFLDKDVGHRLLLSLRTILVDAWLLPTAHFRHGVVTFRSTSTWSGGIVHLGLAAMLAALWIVTARAAWRRRSDLVVMSCAAGVIVQVAISSFYGDEPFLYVAPLVPMVMAVVVAAAGASMKRRVAAYSWVLAAALVVVNLRQLHHISTLIVHNR